ncbi:sensor histidine kinase [Persicitalea sp.]|uniref:sensor histidine kinase n=1 Tax=Persicitalea sp. TaxID=3100273 RepID=UPI00359481E3
MEAKLLRAQFNSHFLFNNLNAINYCILQNDNQKASTYLTLFSRFLRRIAGSPQKDFISFSDEIETLSQYIQIENLRFGSSIRLAVATDPAIDFRGVWIPSLILHSYVENMIWCNLESQTEEGILALSLKRKSGKYHILLETNGVSLDKTHKLSPLSTRETGLKLTLERLQLLNERYGTDLKITKTRSPASKPGSGLRLSFTPFIPQALT